ncbi:MAG: bifunctional riboflavin kinase/FAD synthetase [Gammaproteobacteria bacterium]|nr:bifunctional riboflavin kinase/FAD synthetase [Gammaproteobacteria bacterium]
MEVIRGAHNLRTAHRGCVATIGNFDGVHRGHQAVIRKLLELAARSSLPAIVVVFEPQPAEFFGGANAPARLTNFRDKCALLAQYGVDRLLVLRFNAQLASLTAAEFIQQILIEKLAINGLIVGDDFKFGCDRGGDFSTLQRFAAKFAFTLDYTSSFLTNSERASSTRVRAALHAGDFSEVNELLGHSYRVSGIVVHGNKNGRAMGFPTANLNLNRRRSPLQGIFAAQVNGLGPQLRPAIAYVGTRPILGGEKFVLEVHLFDYAEDFYGRHIGVNFTHKVRDDLPFTDFDALSRQIALDCVIAKKLLGHGT